MRLVHQLSPALSPLLAGIPGITNVDTIADGDTRWALPVDAEILFVLMEDGDIGLERAAAAPRPAGWPGKVRMVQAATVGMDGYPKWMFEAPQVASASGTSTIAIAEHVLAVMLAHAKRLADTTMGSGPWGQDWPPREEIIQNPLGTLEGRTLGLLGLGQIGERVARLAQAFDMEVLATRASDIPVDGVRLVPLEELLQRADHLVLAAPLTPATRGILDAARLASMKPDAHLINIARGPLIDSDALKAALDSGRLWASLDVTDPEPPPPGHWLFSHKRVRVTPHVAFSSRETDRRILQRLVQNIGLMQAGAPLVGQV